ncbi:MAG: hypothetical protein AAF570_08455, partial [Bacteroidota bacterium]
MEAYIVSGYRSAVGKAKRGGFRYMRPDNIAAQVIKKVVADVPALDPTRVDDLIVGCAVPEAEQGLQIGRITSLLSLPVNVPGMTINRYCGSGLEAIVIGMAKIKAGLADCIVAGGTESMSLVPTVGYKTALSYDIAESHPPLPIRHASGPSSLDSWWAVRPRPGGNSPLVRPRYVPSACGLHKSASVLECQISRHTVCLHLYHCGG